MSTALIPLANERPGSAAAQTPAPARADFVAQLIATASRAPQTRTRRRAEPGEAVAAYRLSSQPPTISTHKLSRSL